MRVLFLDAGLGLGGAEWSLLLLLRGLGRTGIEPVVVVFDDGPFRERLAAADIATVRLPPPWVFRRATRYHRFATPMLVPVLVAASTVLAARIAALARRLRVDLIHTNGLKVHVLGGLAGRLTAKPVIWHLRDYPPRGPMGWAITRGARWLPSLILTNSSSVAAVSGVASAHGPRVLRVYNPVDLDRFHPGVRGDRVRKALGFDGAVPVVGLVAHLTPWKGHEQFLAIAREVSNAVPEARFVIAGGPIYETAGHRRYGAALARKAADLGLNDRLVFLGAREDVPEVLAALDVLVHCPTAPEPFGRVLAEAMAMERPVVAGRCGGIPEVVQDGVTGLLVAPGDVKSFVSAVTRLLGDQALRHALGKAGRRRAEELFGVQAHTAAVLEAYRMAQAAAR